MVYIVSYPKTGRTWLRALIGKYICMVYGFPDKEMLNTEYITRESGLPTTIFTHDGSGLRVLPSRLRSYKEISSDKSLYRDSKVIFLTRDIKDTLVSSYFQATRRREGIYRGASISDFIRSDYYGVRKFLTFHKYWYESKHIPKDFLLISYEELHKDAEYVLYRVLRFLGVQPPPKNLLRDVVSFASFDNLRKMEVDNYLDSKYLWLMDANDPESFKCRKGKVGGYTEYLGREDVEYIDAVVDEMGFVNWIK